MKVSSVLGTLFVTISSWCTASTTATNWVAADSAPTSRQLPATEVGATAAAPQVRLAARQDPVKGTKTVALELRLGPHAKNVPIRTGVPFPFGALESLAHLRLEDEDSGSPVAAQFDALAKWPDGSVKVVLVQFVGDLGVAKHYRLAYGGAVSRGEVDRHIAVTKSGATITVDTGLMRFSLNSKGIVDSLWRDTNDDGQFTADERIIDGGDVFLLNAHDGQEYTASAAPNAVVSLEEEGPVRVVVKVEGVLTNHRGAEHMKYLLRYYASRGSDKLDIDLTVIDDRLETDVNRPPTTLPIAVKGLGLRWNYTSTDPPSYRFGGEANNVYSGRVSGEHYLLQTGQLQYVDGDDKGNTFSYVGVGSGQKAPGWLALNAENRHATVMMRDFWQQYPSELSVNAKTVTAGLFPSRALTSAADTTPVAQSGKVYRRPNTLYFLRTGGAKTYQLRIVAHRTTPSDEELRELNESYQRHGLSLVASPEWYSASGVWGQISEGGPGSPSAGYDAALISDIYEPSIERANGDATMYGWRDYGDRLRGGWADVKNGVRIPSFYNDTHVGANNFLKQFLRTGDQRWYHLGEIATRHFMDVDVSHGSRQGYWRTGGSPQPAGEIRCIGHENIDHETRNLHLGHAHVSGLSELYLLTGDKRALDVLKEIANWWKFVAPYFFALPFKPGEKYREAERDYAWPLYAMNEYVRVSGDYEYHRQVSARLVNYLVQWWETPGKHIGYNPAKNLVSNDVIGVNDARAGTGYWTMTRMDNPGPANAATGANPWMAGALITNLIKFYEQDTQFAVVGKSAGIAHPILQNMLLQAQNYIVKYGYDTDKHHFAYSETRRESDGGDHHILFGLAYLDRLFRQESAAGNLRHPEWYDTEPHWFEIAHRRYEELRTKKMRTETLSGGFYGYEIVYPPDFFAAVRELLDHEGRAASPPRRGEQ